MTEDIERNKKGRKRKFQILLPKRKAFADEVKKAAEYIHKFWGRVSVEHKKQSSRDLPRLVVGLGFSIERVRKESTYKLRDSTRLEDTLLSVKDPVECVLQLQDKSERTLISAPTACVILDVVAGRIATLTVVPHLGTLQVNQAEHFILEFQRRLENYGWKPHPAASLPKALEAVALGEFLGALTCMEASKVGTRLLFRARSADKEFRMPWRHRTNQLVLTLEAENLELYASLLEEKKKRLSQEE